MNPLLSFRSLFRRSRLDREMDEELQTHIEEQTRRNIIAGGMPPDEAARAARKQFGWRERIREEVRDQRGGIFVETLCKDIRYAARMLRKSPGFTMVAVLSLALGVGASTALFSVINAVLLQSLPYPDAARLVWLGGSIRNQTNEAGITPADFTDFREQSGSFAQLAASVSDGVPMNLTGTGEPERLTGGLVTANFLETLAVPPLLGRGFAADEGRTGRDLVVVLSHSLWTRRFGADPAVVGRTIQLDSRDITVIGVMPPGFQYPGKVELWMPMSLSAPSKLPIASRELHFLRPVGRLKPDVTRTKAQAELDAIAQRLATAYPTTNMDSGVRLFSLHERIVGNIRPTLNLVLGAVACVLLIACANVPNLLLARAAARRKEICVRAALGASRQRIVRQLLTENLLLALLGSASGVLLALWGVRLLVAFGSQSIPRASEVAVAWPVLGFALALVGVTGVLFGLIPALDAARIDITQALSDGGRGAAGGAQRQRILSALVSGEVALSAVLLVAAGLLINSLVRLEGVAPGFDATNVLTVRIDLPNPYAEPERKTTFYDELQQRLAALPGVEAVGMVSELPVANQSADAPFTIEGSETAGMGPTGVADLRNVNHAYFRAMRIPLLRGRQFSPDEARASAKVAIISEVLAHRFFAGTDPIGQRIRVDVFGRESFEIVGVVGDVRHRGLDRDVRQTLYYPSLHLGYANLVIRTAQNPAHLVTAVRREAAAFAPDQPIANARPMEQWLADSVARPRFRTWLIGSFSAAALVIALVGTYGLMAYSVAQRTSEFGLRAALGASAGDILRMVLRQGMRVALTGIATGLLVAALAGRVVAGLLFDVTPTDPLTFTVIAALLTLTTLFACWLPARRAAKVDPMIALRAE